MTRFRVTLRFRPAPEAAAVTGEWTSEPTAAQCYRDWVGLYGGADGVQITLAEETRSGYVARRTWTNRGEVSSWG